MKKNIACLVLLSFILFYSCTKNGGFLNQTTTTDLTEEAVFADSSRTMDFLAQIYSNIDLSFNPARFRGLAGLEACCDEAEGPSSSTITTYNQFATGSVSAFTIDSTAWAIPYSNIRAVNQYLKHLPTIPFNDALKQRTKGEVLFLRAWYYFTMLKHYGGIPLIGDTVYNVTDNINTARNTYDECVNYITSQCDAAEQLLPLSYSGSDFGRVTKGACLALKARVFLYAASPLFNGQGIAESEPLKSITGYPAYDVNRWKLAADAAKAVMDMGTYSLYVDNTTKPGYGFYEVFQLRQNSEYIFQRMKDPGTSYHDLELLWRPPSRGGGTTTGSSPYQNLVDAFQMKDGKDITDATSGYDPNNPYANRDPRLDYTVTHNGSLVYLRNAGLQPVYTYVGATTGDAVGAGTPTGYYVNKMCGDNVVPDYYNTTPRCYPLIRYAEILLNYAEALNEYSGPSQEVYSAVEAIRQRAGLDPYQLPTGLSQDAMRSVIQHERQVEFAFEEQRFWDVRRWKIADKTDNKAMTGMRITNNAGNYSYQIFTVRDHNFRTPMYLWPIPQSETGKSPDLLQNPGY